MRLLRLGRDNWARTTPARDGILFLLLTFIVGFAALNTGNNLIYLIFGMMISLVVISGILSMINLSGISVETKRLPSLFALTPAPAVFTVKNDKFIPSYSLTITMGNSSSFSSYVPARGEREIKLNCFFKHRGWNSFPELSVSTKFPFGFFGKWIKVSPGREKVLVYPRINDISSVQLASDDIIGEIPSGKPGQGDELRTIREYEYGDNTKHIDWKKTAKVRKMMVREFYSDRLRTARVVFTPENDYYNDLEQYISNKASLFLAYINRGFSVEFIADHKSVIARNNDNKSVASVLRYLALY